MTIAAGIMCPDGILICADSEESTYASKMERRKVRTFENRFMFTGSGTGAYLDMAFDKLRDAYLAVWPTTPADARTATEGILHEIYSAHIDQFFDPADMNRPSMDCVIAIRCADGELALIGSVGTATYLREDYVSVGAGSSLFDYWAKQLMIEEQQCEDASYLGLFIIREVKNNVPGCGGATYAASLIKDVSLPITQGHYQEDELLAGFPGSALKLLGSCLNGDLPDSVIEERINTFIVRVRAFRLQRKVLAQARAGKYRTPRD